MSGKKKELEQTLSTVRGKLTRTDTKLTKAKNRAEYWKKEAKAQQLAAQRAGARVEKLQKKLHRASAALEPVHATAPVEAAASGRAAGEPTDTGGVTVPDETWSVRELRAEAHARGLVGLSNKPKAQLLAALS